MPNFWIAVFTILLLFLALNLVALVLVLWRIKRLTTLLEYIATEYSTKWFTLETLTEQKFKRHDCEDVVTRMLLVKILNSRDYETKEPNDFQDTVITALGNNVFLDSSKLKPFLDLSEFRYIGPPPPRKRRRSRKLDWNTWLPQGLKPAYS